MNWYRFKVELSAVGSGTALATLTTLIVMTLNMDLTGAFLEFPIWMRPLAENLHVAALGFGTAIAVLWLCHWQIFRHYRSRRAYGER